MKSSVSPGMILCRVRSTSSMAVLVSATRLEDAADTVMPWMCWMPISFFCAAV